MPISENEELELVTNLRLRLRHSNRREIGNSNDGLGAGANAASRGDMIFVANDTLSELVWSPHRGLGIRCAVGNVTEQKFSSFFWGPRPVDMVLSPQHTTIPSPTRSKDDASDEAAVNMRTCDSGSRDSINNSSPINNVENDAIGFNSTREEEVSHQDHTNVVNDAIVNNSPGLEEGRIHQVGSLGVKLECVAENDLLSPKNVMLNSAVENRTGQYQLEVCEISKASPIRALATEPKGTEKDISDGDIKKEASQEDDDSCDSVESCNSTKKLSARKKRVLSFKEELIVRSKRVKMQVHETPGSSSFTRTNSSFSNWISAMVKGLSKPNEDGEEPSPAHTSIGNEKKTLETSSRDQIENMGFQSLFQSLYRPNPKVQDQKLLCTDNYQRIEGCKELNVAENSVEGNRTNSDDPLLHSKVLKGKACVPLDSRTSASFKRFCVNPDSNATRDVGSSKNSVAGKMATDIVGQSSSELPSAEKLVHVSVKKDDHLSSLFITHFRPKPVKQQIGCSEEASESSSIKKLHNFPHDVEASCSVKEVEAQNINQIVNFQRFKSSEAMVSVFAKRLDALKNIFPTDLTEKSASSATTCFFCGVVGHDLRCCPQVTENEVDDLLRNVAAYGGKEESPCLCIRCYQLNHWAVSCPNAPSSNKNVVEGSSTEIWHKIGHVNHFSLDMKENATSVEKISSNLQKVTADRSEENAATDFSGFPYPCGSLSLSKGIFEAVKNLQLSRTDIMKWMNSIFSTSLDGYYLRLRRKLGDGLGGTQYHVACICGTQEGKSTESSKKTISVIVGGIRCPVESQYISNQEFLEDELKAWWSATLRDDHEKIPSEDELIAKVEERKRLGL